MNVSRQSKKTKNGRIDSFDLRPGYPLAGKYEVIAKLGSGWEGEVYRIRECNSRIERAAKLFFPQRNVRGKMSRFYARKLHKLRNCPIVIQYYTEETITYRRVPITVLVSEYVEGELLSDFILRQRGKRLSPFPAVHLLHALVAGIEDIHGLRDYHGDLHAGNVIVRRYGLGFDLRLLDMFHWNAPKRENIQDDICDVIRIFYDALGGAKHYKNQPDEVREICCGLRRSLILKRFPDLLAAAATPGDDGMVVSAPDRPGKAQLFVDGGMTDVVSIPIGSGQAVLFSSRSPEKETPNEDSAALIPCGADSCVLAVADGVGGMRGGEQASSLAVRALAQAVEQALRDDETLRTGILNGFEEANRKILEAGSGGATTLAVVEVQGRSIRPYHVGDSLILVTGQRGKVKLESVSHSPVGYGVESGLLDAGEAMYHEERHVVSNVLGSVDMRIEVGSTLELARRDTLVIASDGLTDNLHLAETVAAVRSGPLAAGVTRLAAAARKRMDRPDTAKPSKPDDLTILAFR